MKANEIERENKILVNKMTEIIQGKHGTVMGKGTMKKVVSKTNTGGNSSRLGNEYSVGVPDSSRTAN